MDQISYSAAKAAGKKRYFTGQPCPRGHISERFVSSRNCVACANLHGAAWYAGRRDDPEFRQKRNERSDAWKAANRTRVRATNAAWRAKNPDKIRRWNKEWRAKNPEKALHHSRTWRLENVQKARDAVRRSMAKNPLIKRAAKLNRRAAERRNGGRCTADDIVALFERQEGRCASCRSPDDLEIDHRLPIILGGTSDPSNLQLLCRTCNRSKGGKHPDEWRP